jgi:hypothetical protein
MEPDRRSITDKDDVRAQDAVAAGVFFFSTAFRSCRLAI